MRLAIGWHFYQEGVQKLHEPGWTAAPFFTGSKGPLAPYFEQMVYDGDGRARLNFVRDKFDRVAFAPEKTIDIWDQYRVNVEKYYGYDDKQKKAAKECLASFKRQLKYFYDENGDDILEYFNGLDRRDANRQDPTRKEVPSLHGQAVTIEAEVSGKRGPWLAQIDQMWASYARDLNAIATDEQSGGPVSLARPGRGYLFGLMDTLTIDRIIPTFDTVVGVLLVLGLCTRLSALAGAGFLFSICLTQWPGAPGALPIYYQAIEMIAMLVLAAVGAGQFAGLDFIIYRYFKSFRTSQQETNQ